MPTNDLQIQIFSKRLKGLLKQRRMTERELCAEIGKSHSYLRAFTKPNGPSAKNLPSHLVLQSIATTLGVAVEALLLPQSKFDLSGRMAGLIDQEAERILKEISFAMQRRLNIEKLTSDERPTTGDVLNWLRMTGNKIHKDTSIWNFVDIHNKPAPTDQLLYPHN